MVKSIRSKVFDQVNSDVEKGVNVLNLGFKECNDYAQTITNLMNVRDKAFYRFETVARNVRLWKEYKRKSQGQF